jgi:hypothetical protein
MVQWKVKFTEMLNAKYNIRWLIFKNKNNATNNNDLFRSRYKQSNIIISITSYTKFQWNF